MSWFEVEVLLLRELFSCLFPPSTSSPNNFSLVWTKQTHEHRTSVANEKCHIKEFSPKSKFSPKFFVVQKGNFKPAGTWMGSSNAVINSFVTEMNSSEMALNVNVRNRSLQLGLNVFQWLSLRARFTRKAYWKSTTWLRVTWDLNTACLKHLARLIICPMINWEMFSNCTWTNHFYCLTYCASEEKANSHSLRGLQVKVSVDIACCNIN